MPRFLRLNGKIWLTLLLVLGVAAGGFWYFRTPLLKWYYLRGLAAASEQERELWVERVVSLDGEAVPDLLDELARDNERARGNAELALAALLRHWGTADPRSVDLAAELAGRFESLGPGGRQSVINLQVLALRSGNAKVVPPERTAQAAWHVLSAAAELTDPPVRARALALAEVLVETAHGQNLEVYRKLIHTGLRDQDAARRVRAIHLTLHAALRNETELLEHVVPLLHDKIAEVRRAALLAVGMAERVIAEDDLLPLLHDPDEQVRRLCETALRGRGLQDEHLKLARLISDARPEARLEVVRHLHGADDLDPGVWLRRLSHDPSPAVRAAAVRYAAAHPAVNFRERLLEMQDNDPSPTVRSLAAFYLRWQPRDR